MKQPLGLFFMLSLTLATVQIVMAQSIQPPFIYSIDWSNNGSFLAITTRDALTIYDAEFNVIGVKPFPQDIAFEVPDILLSPTGDQIFVDREIWDSATFQLLSDFNEIRFLPFASQWAPDGLSVALRSDLNPSTSLYSTMDGRLLRSFDFGIWKTAETPIWSPNQAYFATVVPFDTVHILDAIAGTEIAQYPLEGEIIIDFSWSPDSHYLALVSYTEVQPNTHNSYPSSNSSTGAFRNSIIIIATTTGDIVSLITGHREVIHHVVWSPDGQQIAGNSSSNSLYIWNVQTGGLVDSYLLNNYAVETLKYSPYSGRLLIGYNIARANPSSDDSVFIPISSFAQPHLNGIIEFVAPAASPERLQTILTQCVADPNLVTAGNDLIAAGQYSEFNQWLQQLPLEALPLVCAADLELMATALRQQGTP